MDIGYIVNIAIYNDNKDITLGKIKVKKNDDFDIIINKINNILIDHNLDKVKDFHYIQEDSDIAYINKKLMNKTDINNAIKHNTIFYVYYNER